MDERLLLVEDDPTISELTARGLGQAGFQVVREQDGRQAIVRFRDQAFDLVLLDIMLPSLDGLEVCRQIRAMDRVAILMLTAKNETADVVLGLEAGADDYLSKPFEMPELVARVRALLRRVAQGSPSERFEFGSLKIDVRAHKAFRGETPLHLSAMEFKLLVALARNAGKRDDARDAPGASLGLRVPR